MEPAARLASRWDEVESTGVDGSAGWESSSIPTQAFTAEISMNPDGIEGSDLPVVYLPLLNGLASAD